MARKSPPSIRMSFYLSFEESSDDGPGAKISGGSWENNDFDRNDIKASLASIRMSEDTPMEEKSEGKDDDTSDDKELEDAVAAAKVCTFSARAQQR